jgi:hypothetical protein
MPTKPHRLRSILPVLAFAAVVTTISVRCAHVQQVETDIKTCFGPDVKGDLTDFVNAIGASLVCDIATGCQAIPVCTETGLATIEQEIGPNGAADVKCVLGKWATEATKPGGGDSREDAIKRQRARLLLQRANLGVNDVRNSWRISLAFASPPGEGAPGLVGGGGG